VRAHRRIIYFPLSKDFTITVLHLKGDKVCHFPCSQNDMEAAARRQATLLGHLRISDDETSVARAPCAARVRIRELTVLILTLLF